MTSITYTRTLTVNHSYDVLVVGGGAAGVAAAYGAARTGATVLLIEKGSCLGGLGTAGFVPAFTGIGDGKRILCGGFGTELFKRMRARHGFGTETNYAIKSEVLKAVYEDMMAENNVRILFETTAVDIIREQSHIDGVIISSVEGLELVQASAYVDCTGDGNLSALAGADFQLGDEKGRIMPASLCSLWANVDWMAWEQAKTPIFDILIKAINDHQFFQHPDYHHTGMSKIGPTTAAANMGHLFQLNPTSKHERTQGFIKGRKLLDEFRQFYQQRVPGFQNCELVTSATILGIRESRRITGDWCLTIEDYMKRRVFHDRIGCFAYTIDIHPYDNTKAEFQRFFNEFHTPNPKRFKQGEHYTIPFRALVVKGIDNLLVAGRCISADHQVIASIRVMPGCYITGQAAGVAAAMNAARHLENVRQIPLQDLQQQLLAIGAILD